MSKLLVRISRAIRRWLADLSLPQWRYRGRDVRLRVAARALRHTVDSPDADVLDAYQLNLSTVLEALETNRLGHYIVERSWGSRPVVGVTTTTVGGLVAGLRQLSRFKPIYVVHERRRRPRRVYLARSVRRRLVRRLIADGFTVTTFLHNPMNARKLGLEYGCEIDVWDEEQDGTLRNVEPRTSRADVIHYSARRPTEVTAYGIPSVTYPPLAGPEVFDVQFPIDAVYLWVDGSDPEWRERKARRLAELGHAGTEEAQIESRFRQFDELRYSLRSLERYAPWVRNVFLVTDRQRPSWLDEKGTNLTVVDHAEIIPASALPTFNSHALTASLHHIPGLSHRFLLLNDDFFFGRPLGPDRLFASNGVARFFLSKSLISVRPAAAHECARLHSCDLIESVTGFRPTNVLQHTPYAFNRELLADIEEEYATEVKATIHNPLRTPRDVVPEYLHHYIGYSRRLTVPGEIDYRYFAFGEDLGMDSMRRYQRSGQAEVFCINDQGGDPEQIRDHYAILDDFLESQFPHQSRYESGR